MQTAGLANFDETQFALCTHCGEPVTIEVGGKLRVPHHDEYEELRVNGTLADMAAHYEIICGMKDGSQKLMFTAFWETFKVGAMGQIFGKPKISDRSEQILKDVFLCGFKAGVGAMDRVLHDAATDGDLLNRRFELEAELDLLRSMMLQRIVTRNEGPKK